MKDVIERGPKRYYFANATFYMGRLSLVYFYACPLHTNRNLFWIYAQVKY